MKYVVASSMALLHHVCYFCTKMVMFLQPRSSFATLEACCAIMVQDGPFYFLDEPWYPWWVKYSMKSSMILKIIQEFSEVGIAQGLHHVVSLWWIMDVRPLVFMMHHLYIMLLHYGTKCSNMCVTDVAWWNLIGFNLSWAYSPMGLAH